MKNLFYKLKDSISQKLLLRKYNKYNIPIRENNNWYLKELEGLKQDIIYIEKYSSSSMNHFYNYADAFISYEYQYGIFKDTSEDDINSYYKKIHAHSFYEVLECVYYFPESFKILKENNNQYSEQELKWIDKLQKKCLDDNLKDVGYLKVIDNNVNLIFNNEELLKRDVKNINGKKVNKDNEISYIML